MNAVSSDERQLQLLLANIFTAYHVKFATSLRDRLHCTITYYHIGAHVYLM